MDIESFDKKTSESRTLCVDIFPIKHVTIKNPEKFA
jgi:hypothetical protein